MEDKIFDNEIERQFSYFERQFGMMRDPHPDEIREFIATIILAAAHDNSLVDAAFKWVASRNKQN